MARIREIVIDCTSAAALARFWAAALDDYHVRPYDDAEIARLAALGLKPETDPSVAVDGPGPTIFLQEIPGERKGRTGVHLDLISSDRRAEITRLVALGAAVREEHADYTVMLDPEGNPFCILEPDRHE